MKKYLNLKKIIFPLIIIVLLFSSYYINNNIYPITTSNWKIFNAPFLNGSYSLKYPPNWQTTSDGQSGFVIYNPDTQVKEYSKYYPQGSLFPTNYIKISRSFIFVPAEKYLESHLDSIRSIFATQIYKNGFSKAKLESVDLKKTKINNNLEIVAYSEPRVKNFTYFAISNQKFTLFGYASIENIKGFSMESAILKSLAITDLNKPFFEVNDININPSKESFQPNKSCNFYLYSDRQNYFKENPYLWGDKVYKPSDNSFSILNTLEALKFNTYEFTMQKIFFCRVGENQLLIGYEPLSRINSDKPNNIVYISLIEPYKNPIGTARLEVGSELLGCSNNIYFLNNLLTINCEGKDTRNAKYTYTFLVDFTSKTIKIADRHLD